MGARHLDAVTVARQPGGTKWAPARRPAKSEQNTLKLEVTAAVLGMSAVQK